MRELKWRKRVHIPSSSFQLPHKIKQIIKSLNNSLTIIQTKFNGKLSLILFLNLPKEKNEDSGIETVCRIKVKTAFKITFDNFEWTLYQVCYGEPKDIMEFLTIFW